MDVLKVGQKLSLYFQKDNKLVEMLCSISEIKDDRLVINLPQYFMRYIEFLEVGKRLTVKVFSKIGTLDFNTVVITSPMEDNFEIELDYNAIKLTSGDDMPVINAVETLNIKHGEENTDTKTFEIATEFIKFYSDKKFEKNDILDCALILPQNCGTIYFKATLTEVDPIYENEYTISDFCMTEDDRQTLLYYMYLYSNDTDWNE